MSAATPHAPVGNQVQRSIVELGAHRELEAVAVALLEGIVRVDG